MSEDGEGAGRMHTVKYQSLSYLEVYVHIMSCE